LVESDDINNFVWLLVIS